MRRRFGLWIAIAALAVRVVAPLAAHTAAQPADFIQICSVAGNAMAAGSSLPAERQPGGLHLLSRCADCPFGSGIAMLPAALVVPLLPADARRVAGAEPGTADAAMSVLLPPPRGPPAGLTQV